MFVVIYAINPGYMRPMLVSATGKAMLGLSVGLVVVGYTVMSRIADVDL
jgi:Flp pilus assembly protein TadB